LVDDRGALGRSRRGRRRRVGKVLVVRRRDADGNVAVDKDGNR
jgi:hypothetical protein